MSTKSHARARSSGSPCTLQLESQLDQEIQEDRDLGRERGWLDQSAASFAAQGVADPSGAALAQLSLLVQREANVMAFNNVFVILALAFAMLLPLILFTRQARATGFSGH
jgi:DHA2 family multidrug resistance protein